MIGLLCAGFLCVGQGASHPDVEHIDVQAKDGVAAAVVVADSIPLVHTRQVMGDALAPGGKRLAEILKAAGSSLDRVVKLNFVVHDDQQLDVLKKELAGGTFGTGKPAVSFVHGRLPGGSTWAVDAVAMGTRRPAWSKVEHGAGYAILPPGTRIYVSGQAVPGKDLAEATRATLAELRETLKFLGLKENAVVQVKAFLQPMAQHKIAADEMNKFFQAANTAMPPLVLIEWQSPLPIEIELIVWGGRERAGAPIEYLTPPNLKASPVYSRVARVNDGKLIYLSSLHGKTENDPAAEIPEIFEQMRGVLTKAGSDFRHLAKATYYVASAQATKKMGEIRPRYYDPKRPPAASLAVVPGVGLPKRSVTMDMIAVPSPSVRVNEYGPAQHGHGLSDELLRDGFIALFDGKTGFGWTDAEVKDGILLAGRSNLTLPGGIMRLNVRKAGRLAWGDEIKELQTGNADLAMKRETPASLRVANGLQLRSLVFKAIEVKDITPKTLGSDWKALDHPKLPKERRAVWTLQDGVLRAVGGPGCLEYQGKHFANFMLQMEVRTKLRHANSGVFFRAIPGSFMNGYEAQIYNRCHDGDVSRPWTWATGAIDDRQNTRRLVSRDGDWFHYTVIATGDRLATFVNGHQCVDWQDARKENENPRLGRRTSAGALQLQAHDAGTDVEFRNLRVTSWD